MQHMSSAEVRQSFLDFFEEMGHKPVASSSLVPSNDPTLLFVNAGMVQFKDVFLGLDQRDYKRATTSQKCMRVSGKHNDLENVGPSPRHQTFFEMLGNFSFGDYFKRDAIRYAYELLTVVYKLPADRLVFTVYENDDEAYDCWVGELGLSPKRVARMGPSTNFWQMADTGPCGPTSEIHWDNQPELGEDSIVPMLQAEDDRFLEIWNLVFMQFNRQQADPDHSGQWDMPLPAPGVDTGMGLERIVSVLQGVDATYDTDLFRPIIQRTQELAGHSDEQRDANIVPYRVIADHVRAAVFLISDGVLPGAKGRSAIPRIVIRRAARFGSKLGFDEPFLAKVADVVFDIMGEHYSEILDQAESIKRSITLEEERFHRTMQRGLTGLEGILDGLKVMMAEHQEKLDHEVQQLLRTLPMLSAQETLESSAKVQQFLDSVDQSFRQSVQDVSPLVTKQIEGQRRTLLKTLSRYQSNQDIVPDLRDTLNDTLRKVNGEASFYLKSTLGLPFEVTKDVAEEHDLPVDEDGFKDAEKEHALISGGGQAMGEIESRDFYRQLLSNLQVARKLSTEGVDHNPYSDAPVETTVLAILRDGRKIDTAIAGENVEIVLKETNFYVEAGGQVSDTGPIRGECDTWIIDVEAMKRPVAGLVVHVGEVIEGKPTTGDLAIAEADPTRRLGIKRNHTATHILHATLRRVLGNHVQQKGSLVTPDRLRFDFSHPEHLSGMQLGAVASETNIAILNNYNVLVEEKALEVARQEGAIALFGETYGDSVRTVAIEDNEQRYSYELCGGLHVNSTAEIGSFVLFTDVSVGAGIRRIEALTGFEASNHNTLARNKLWTIAGELGTIPNNIIGRLQQLKNELSSARREIEDLRRRQAKHDFEALIDNQLESVNGVHTLVAQLDAVPPETMREMTDWFRNRVDKGVMVLASEVGGKPHIVVAVTDPLVKAGIRAGDLIKPIAKIVGGGGGGRPQMAQAGGTDCSKIDAALAHARALIAEV